MSQALRNQYLQQMGIVQYVGRDLPVVASQAASPSPVALQPSESAAISETETPVAESMGSRVNALIREKSMAELVNIGLQDTGAPAIAAPATPAQRDSAPASDIELRLALWQPTEELLVCSSVEGSLPEPEQILLLGNILQAMGQGSGPLPQMELVEWPPYPNMAGDESEVREFLTTLIGARINSRATKIILLLGDAAQHWLLTSEQKASASNGQVDIFAQVTALLIPSLSTMIEEPSLKRDAWQTVRYLSPQRHVHRADS